MQLAFLLAVAALAAICLLSTASFAEDGGQVAGAIAATAPTKAKPAPKLPAPAGLWAGNPTKFFEGAFLGFIGHESGHLVTYMAMDTDLYLMPVHYGPFRFSPFSRDAL